MTITWSFAYYSYSTLSIWKIPPLLLILMAMVMYRCNAVHIAWLRRSVATLEATGHCHWAIIHIVLPHGDHGHQFWLKKGVVAFCNSCSKACAQKAQKQTFSVDRWWIVTIWADELSNAKNVTFATPPPREILFDNKIESQVVTLSSSSTKKSHLHQKVVRALRGHICHSDQSKCKETKVGRKRMHSRMSHNPPFLHCNQ